MRKYPPIVSEIEKERAANSWILFYFFPIANWVRCKPVGPRIGGRGIGVGVSAWGTLFCWLSPLSLLRSVYPRLSPHHCPSFVQVMNGTGTRRQFIPQAARLGSFVRHRRQVAQGECRPGSLLAIGMLAMALAALNAAARPDGATELSSVASLK